MALNEREIEFLRKAIEGVSKPVNNVAGIITVRAVLDNDGRMVARFAATFEPFYPGNSEIANAMFGLVCGESEQQKYERLKAKFEQQ
jgi:hypothetical protein